MTEEEDREMSQAMAANRVGDLVYGRVVSWVRRGSGNRPFEVHWCLRCVHGACPASECSV